MEEKKEKLSINDIAAQLNVSKTAVSFIMNGKAKEKRISDKLVAKVMKLVEEVGYQPNYIAQSLRTGKTKIIGLIIEDISNPFFASIAKQIEDKAYDNGYRIIYCSTENNPERAKSFLSMFKHLNVDGYIIAPTPGIEKDVDLLSRADSPIILFDRKFGNSDIMNVLVDNEGGTYTGTEHLIARGYTNIAFITISLEPEEENARIRGYKKAIQENKLSPYLHVLPYRDNQSYTSAITKILKENPELDAVFFGANYLGIRGLEAISRLKLKIPKDLAVLSFDDNDLFQIYSPTITVVAQPIDQISETIITTLLQALNAGKYSPETKNISLPTSLIVRESTPVKQKIR